MQGQQEMRRRGVALGLALLLGLMLLLAVGFALLEFGHDCTGERCAICHQMGWLRVLLANMTLLSLALMVSRGIRGLGRVLPPLKRNGTSTATPVSLHTRMNN